MERDPQYVNRMISVVVPVYRSGAYVADAIDSVLKQGYPNFEIIVVDDGSKDDTRAALEPYIGPGLVRYFERAHRGPAAARNTGIAAARGGYIAFLDADDLWHPRKLRRSVDFLEKGGFDWICTAMEKIDRNGGRYVKRIPADSWVLDPGTGRIRQLRKGLFYFSSIPVHTPTILAKKECFDGAGVFDERFRVGEDTDLWLRFEEAGFNGGYLDEALTTYRYNPNSITRGRALDGLRDHVGVARKHLAILGKDDPVVRRSFGEFMWEMSRTYFARKWYLTAARYFAESLRYAPGNLRKAAAGFRRRYRPAAPVRKTNVLFYDPTSGFGGSSRCLASWLERLDRDRFTPFVAAHYNGPMIQKIKEMDIRVAHIPFRSFFLYRTRNVERYPRVASYLIALFNLIAYDVPSAMHLYHAVRKFKIDVMHLNAPVTSSIAGVIASRAAGIPCICHLHDTKPAVRKEKFFARWVDRFVVLTPKAASLYRTQYRNARLDLIPNGVNAGDFRPMTGPGELRRKFGIGRAERIVGIVGRLVEGKGFTDFIRAAAIVTARLDRTVFMIVGDDPMEGKEYENRLRDLVKETGLAQKVVFAGWQDRATDFIAAFDVLVQASSTFPEGFGLTVVEAMALRKPVIVTDIPGPSEIVVDAVTGFIVPPADPVKMADAIERILTNGRLARMMGANGRRRVDECFSIAETVRRIEASYGSLLAERGKQAAYSHG